MLRWPRGFRQCRAPSWFTYSNSFNFNFSSSFYFVFELQYTMLLLLQWWRTILNPLWLALHHPRVCLELLLRLEKKRKCRSVAKLVEFQETIHENWIGKVHTLYNVLLRIARKLLETKENVKILIHPVYHTNLDWFSWEWSKKNSKWPFFKIPNSWDFFAKILQIGPLVSRIDWCEAH